MENDIYFVQLFDLYKGLLTENQREIFYSHYCLDLSLAEIAEEHGVKRQSVLDAIKKVKEKLVEIDNALHLKSKFDAIAAFGNRLSPEDKSALEDLIGV